MKFIKITELNYEKYIDKMYVMLKNCFLEEGEELITMRDFIIESAHKKTKFTFYIIITKKDEPIMIISYRRGSMYLYDEDDKNEKTAFIYNVCRTKDKKYKGIGKRAMDILINKLKRKKIYNNIKLSVDYINKDVLPKYYEQFGFKIMNMKKIKKYNDHIQIDEEKNTHVDHEGEHEIIMIKKLMP